jgi:hypothetical protein
MILGKNKPGFASMMPGYGSPQPAMPDMTIQDNAGFGGGGGMPAQRPRGGGIDWKNVLVSALGGAADGASRFFGGPSTFSIMQSQQQQLQAQAAERQQQEMQAAAQRFAAGRLGLSADEITAAGGKLDDVIANRLKPDSAPAIQQNAEYIRQTRGDAAADAYLDNYGQRPDEPRMVTLPDGRAIFGTMSEIQQLLGGAGGGQMPPDTLPADFFKGGSGGNVGGSFPR